MSNPTQNYQIFEELMSAGRVYMFLSYLALLS